MKTMKKESPVFVVLEIQAYPFYGAVELCDKRDKNGEGLKITFCDRKKLETFAKRLHDFGYVNYQGF